MNRKSILPFHDSKVTSHEGLLLYPELDEALGLVKLQTPMHYVKGLTRFVSGGSSGKSQFEHPETVGSDKWSWLSHSGNPVSVKEANTFRSALSISRLCSFVAMTTLLFFASSVQATTIIDTTSVWAGQDVGTWGEPSSATFGQTFTVGADSRLDYWTFYVSTNEGTPINFAGYVMAWNGTHATGPVLFQSGELQATSAHLQAVTVSTGELELTPGDQYVALFSASNFFDGATHLGYNGYVPPSLGVAAYDGGNYVYIDNGNNFSALTTSNWVTTYPDPNGDAAFVMGFNVPEPATGSLLLIASAGILMCRRRKQSA